MEDDPAIMAGYLRAALIREILESDLEDVEVLDLVYKILLHRKE
jgi:hypothetical protein